MTATVLPAGLVNHLKSTQCQTTTDRYESLRAKWHFTLAAGVAMEAMANAVRHLTHLFETLGYMKLIPRYLEMIASKLILICLKVQQSMIFTEKKEST